MQAIGENTVLAQRYTLTRKLAAHAAGPPASGGGQGSAHQELWIAVDSTLDREVTATVFPADFTHAEAALDSARRAAGVEDHHLPRVLDVGTEDGTAYVISEALHGAESIAAMLQFDPLPAEEVRRLVGEAASGLGAAAARGLHHLQLTPHDIVCSPDGAVSVLGLPTDAALAGADDLSSEEASRADTVALVQIAYAGLTGYWPGDRTVPGLGDVARRADGELPAPSELASGVPGDLDTLCRTTLGADEGPRTPGELARQLAPWSSERVTSSARRNTGSDGRSGATLQSVPGGDRTPAAEPAASAGGDDATTAEVPTRTPLPRAGATTTTTVADRDETTQISRSDLMKTRERTAAPPPPDDDDDDYDPSFTELEPPLPGFNNHFEPDHRTSRLALALVVLLVIIAVVFAAIGLRGIGGSTGSDDATTQASASASASASDSDTSSSSAPKPSAKPVTIDRVTSYGVGGGENNALAKNVTDDDTDSYWNSGEYQEANFGGRGGGGGLLVDLGKVKPLKNLKITTSGGSSTIEFYVSDSIEPVSTREPEATWKGSGTHTVDLSGVQARYITVWVTSLSKQDDGSFQERINDIKVFS